jgi:hypothetical protein
MLNDLPPLLARVRSCRYGSVGKIAPRDDQLIMTDSDNDMELPPPTSYRKRAPRRKPPSVMPRLIAG